MQSLYLIFQLLYQIQIGSSYLSVVGLYVRVLLCMLCSQPLYLLVLLVL
jgi:hypothetical protein